MDWDVWGPPFAVLGVSIVIGAIVVLRMKSNEPAQESIKEDLVARKNQLMEAIRELDADAGKMEPTIYAQHRERLLDEASEVLKSIDVGAVASNTTQVKSLSNSSVWGYVLGSLVFFSVLGYLLQEYSRPRQEGEIMTGGSMETSQGAQAGVQMQLARKERIEAAERKLEEDPKNLEALHVLTYDYLLYQDMTKAMNYMETARGINPSDSTFLTHLGILQMSVGMYERATIGFTQALAMNPENTRALLWQALMYARVKEPDKALENLKKIDGKLQLQEEIYFAEQLLNDLQKPPAILSGVIQANGAPSKGTLFVIVRRAESAKGPPVAVKKIPNPTFPIGYELSKGDMVMGGTWPEEVWLEARLDMDGNAMTKSDEDWVSSKLGPLQGTNTDLTLSLSGGKATSTPPLENGDGEAAKVSGTISASSAPSGTLFIIARRSQVAKGPPVAVQKVTDPTFPLSFSLSEKNMMMGGTWPKEVWLEARLDMDGDAMTKSKDDWTTSMVGPAPQGASGLSLSLSAQ